MIWASHYPLLKSHRKMDIRPTNGRVKPRSLRVGSFNANGLRKQRDEVFTFLCDHQLDVLLVQETFLKPGIKDPRIANYNIVRNDRLPSALGGTLIYYKKSLYCSPMDPPSGLQHIEVSVCRLGLTGHQPVVLVSAYLGPPNSGPRALCSSDLELLLNLGGAVIIAGDLNAKSPAWCSLTTNPRGRLLESLSQTLHFDIVAPMLPTHFPANVDHRPDVLDIALLKNINLGLCSIEVHHELASDHRPVVIELGSRLGQGDLAPATKSKMDWERLGESLKSTTSPFLDSIPDVIVSSQDTVDAIDSLTGHVQQIVRDCTRRVPASDHLRWNLPASTRALLTEKNAAVRAYDSYPTEQNRVRLRSLQRAVRSRIAQLRCDRWDGFVGGLEPTHQAFWQLCRKLKSADTVASMPPLKRPDLSLAFDDDEKAECLAVSLEMQCSPSILPVDQEHLSLVVSEVQSRSGSYSSAPSTSSTDAFPRVTADEVQTIIRDLHPRKAPGADGITNKVLKLFPPHLISLLTAIFNAAMANNSFPQPWKDAVVIGIPKPGKPKDQPSSYRPISLLNTMGKIYERLIYTRLRDFAEDNSLIPDTQFGFRAKHSCVQQVHRITEHILEGFSRSRPHKTGALFFDVAKAFDKVWHEGLLYKLYQLNVPDRLVLIIRDFLSNRAFRYRAEGSLSAPHPIRAGVPQGSVLSPLLFTLFTSDFPIFRPSPLKTHVALFADDTAIYCSSRQAAPIYKSLQCAADILGSWFRKWRIEVNPDKSAAVLFRRRGEFPPAHSISMLGTTIPWERKVRYLGVMLDSGLTFGSHIKMVRDRAAFALGRLHCLLHKRSKLSLRNKIRIYTTCIRPIMTYASVVFAHAAKSHIHRLQVIQNRFMRNATGAPWFLRNENLHIDLGLPTIRQYLKQASVRYFDSAPIHPNQLVVSASVYVPPVVSSVRKRRPRSVLGDRDDAITVAMQQAEQLATRTNTPRPPLYRPRRRGRASVTPRVSLFNYRHVPGRFSPQTYVRLPSPSNALSRGRSPARGRPQAVA